MHCVILFSIFHTHIPQGRHVHKLRINYKKEGDGFQCEGVCADGFTFTIFFRNQLSPKKYTDKGLSPLHGRVAAMLSQLPHKAYVCGVDNLYNSAKFVRYCYASLSMYYFISMLIRLANYIFYFDLSQTTL